MTITTIAEAINYLSTTDESRVNNKTYDLAMSLIYQQYDEYKTAYYYCKDSWEMEEIEDWEDELLPFIWDDREYRSYPIEGDGWRLI